LRHYWRRLIESLKQECRKFSIQRRNDAVSGYAGIGKSALVQELYKPLLQSEVISSLVSLTNFSAIVPTAPLSMLYELVLHLLRTRRAVGSGDRACSQHWESTDRSSLM